MDFEPTPEAAELVALVRELCAALAGEDSLAELDARFGPGSEAAGTERGTARINEALWSALLEAGVPQALAPEACGGAALGAVAEALVFRELGRALAPVPLESAVSGSHALTAAGHVAEATDVAEGRSIASIPDLPAGLGAPASGEAVLHRVPWAPIADMLLVLGSGMLRIVPLGGGGEAAGDGAAETGVEIERLVPVDFSCAGRVTLAQGAGDEAPIAEAALELLVLRRRMHLAAYQWGVLDAALRRTAEYASGREQFGRAIGTFQAVSARLADGLIDVDAVRLSVLRAASELDNCGGEPGDAARAAVGAAHYWACEAAHRVSHTAVHVHGGTGLDRSEGLHRYFLAAKAAEFRLGGTTTQLAELGGILVDSGDPWA
ncbi:acyl-CoA dehydrogenase family protein [Dietzia sp.]|uniref:acyl-CoA dehydrogenase family protein n=1 Tax=Dietzia sp. TaxID=1871616 RepID=UPI002FDA18E6